MKTRSLIVNDKAFGSVDNAYIIIYNQVPFWIRVPALISGTKAKQAPKITIATPKISPMEYLRFNRNIAQIIEKGSNDWTNIERSCPYIKKNRTLYLSFLFFSFFFTSKQPTEVAKRPIRFPIESKSLYIIFFVS